MKKISETIVFFGSGPVAAKSLGYLAEHFAIEAVITKAVPPHHREPAPVEVLAKQQQLYLLYANSKTELDKVIAKHQFKSRLGIIVDYGVIVSQTTINAFELGILNSHFSLLPRWRGADPISFAILEGDPKTGVSLMLIEPTLDTGKLLVQKGLLIEPNDTTPTLTAKLINLSNELLGEYIPRYLAGNITARAQPHPQRATYSRKLTKADGLIDWTKSAGQIEQEIRAFIDWPKSRTTLSEKEVIITQAKVLNREGEPGQIVEKQPRLIIACGSDALEIIKLKPAGKNEMTASEFLRGYQII